MVYFDENMKDWNWNKLKLYLNKDEVGVDEEGK